MRQILKIRKTDKDEHDEQESLLDIYKRALGMLPDSRRNGSGRGIATPIKQGRSRRSYSVAGPTRHRATLLPRRPDTLLLDNDPTSADRASSRSETKARHGAKRQSSSNSRRALPDGNVIR